MTVFMDLASGYIFVEDIAEDGCYETWKDKVQNIVDKFGVKIKHIVLQGQNTVGFYNSLN